MASHESFYHPPGQPVPQVIPDEELAFSEEEKQKIEAYRRDYPTKQAAVMHVLWLAQNKFGWLPAEVIRLVADELNLPESHVFGVATFYTQYYKRKMGRYVLDVCTCFSCQLCGGYDVLHYLEEKLGIKKGETTEDGLFSIQEVECLGACGSAPMLQITNGPYVHHLTEEKVDRLLKDLRNGRMPAFTSITLPQDEDELNGNRRSDLEVTEGARKPPVSESVS